MEIKEGIYPLNGKAFYIEGSKFVVRERKNETERKPKNYLIALSPFQYISSLFPVGKEQAFNFDFKQELFELELLEGEGKAVLKKLEPIQEES